MRRSHSCWNVVGSLREQVAQGAVLRGTARWAGRVTSGNGFHLVSFWPGAACFLLHALFCCSRRLAESNFEERYCGGRSIFFFPLKHYEILYLPLQDLYQKRWSYLGRFLFVWCVCCGAMLWETLCMAAGKQAVVWVFPPSAPCSGEQFSSHFLYQFHTAVISLTSVGFLVTYPSIKSDLVS